MAQQAMVLGLDNFGGEGFSPENPDKGSCTHFAKTT
jgi:hypothetical protein